MAKSSKDLKQHFEKFKDSVQNGLTTLQLVVYQQHCTSNFYPSTLELQECIKSGWLKKLSSVLKTWQKKWLVLKGDSIYYYLNSNDIKPPQGSIFLPGCNIVEHAFKAADPEKFVFSIMPDNKSQNQEIINLSAESAEERTDWIRVIKQILYGSVGGAIFGKPLEETLRFETSMDPCRKVPEIVEACVDYIIKHGLQEEGIFRLTGRSSVIKRYCDTYDRGEKPRMEDDEDMDVHSASSVLKLYLRNLHSSLIPPSSYEDVIRAVTREMPVDASCAMGSLREIMRNLPKPNYNLLQYLCKFLHQVAQHHGTNKMTFFNLATIFSTAFIRPEIEEDAALLMATANSRKAVTHVLIENQSWLFNVDVTPFGGVVVVEDLLGLNESLYQRQQNSDMHNIESSKVNETPKERISMIERKVREKPFVQAVHPVVLLRRCTMVEKETDQKVKESNRKCLGAMKGGEDLEDAYQNWKMKRTSPVPVTRTEKSANNDEISSCDGAPEMCNKIIKTISVNQDVNNNDESKQGNSSQQENVKGNDGRNSLSFEIGDFKIHDVDALTTYLDNNNLEKVSKHDLKSVIDFLLEQNSLQRKIIYKLNNKVK